MCTFILGFYPWNAKWPSFDQFVRLVIKSGTTVVHKIYFKRVEVVFERGGGSQGQAQYPKPKCPVRDRLFPEMDLGQEDTFLNIHIYACACVFRSR